MQIDVIAERGSPLLRNQKAVRDWLWSHLDPGTAASVGLTVHQLQQAAFGCQFLSPEQLKVLAKRMGIA